MPNNSQINVRNAVKIGQESQLITSPEMITENTFAKIGILSKWKKKIICYKVKISLKKQKFYI